MPSYAASLAKIPDGKAKTRGVAFGDPRCRHPDRASRHDGRNAPTFIHPTAGARVWRPTPPAFAPIDRPMAGIRHPVARAQRSPVRQNRTTAGADLGALYTGLQRGQGTGFGELDGTHARADRHRTVLLGPCLRAVQYGTARPGRACGSWTLSMPRACSPRST